MILSFMKFKVVEVLGVEVEEALDKRQRHPQLRN